MRMMVQCRRLAIGAVGLSSAATAIVASYLGVLTVAALVPARRRRIPSMPPTRFVVMVPAHNEAAVIERTITSLQAIDYPDDDFDVHVVADHCTDTTADVVRSRGVHVHERGAPGPPGKGPALNWLLERIESAPFDVAVIVDADTVVEAGLLRAFDDAFRSGTLVAQGHYSVLEPERSSATSFRFAALACRHHLRSLGRNRISASAGLFGNGMAFRREVLERHPWSGHLVEDAELQVNLLVSDGMIVQYVPDAVVRAEMPHTRERSASQNARWERGRVQLVRTLMPRVLRRLGRGGPRVALLDTAMDLLVPPLSVVALLQLWTLSASAGLTMVDRRLGRRLGIMNIASSSVLAAHVLAGLLLVHAPWTVYRGLIHAPRAVVWKGGLWLRMVRSRELIAWERTSRNEEV